MYCANCGTKLTDGAAFCHECGTPVAQVVPVVPAAGLCPRQRSRRGWVTLALCLIALLLVLVGEVVGYLVGMALRLDAEISATVGGAVAAMALVAVLGGWRAVRPSRAAVMGALRSCWWLLAVDTALLVLDIVGTIMDGSFVLSDNMALSMLGTVVLCAAVGVSEECMFRGLLLGGMLDAFGRTRHGVVSCVVVSSLLFGMAHIDWGSLDYLDALSVGQALLKTIQTGVFGFVMAVLALRHRSLAGAITLHAASDFLLLVSHMGIQGQTAEVDYVSAATDEALMTMCLYLVIIALYVPLLVRAVRMLREMPAPELGWFHRP